ncbi:MAG: hypothetical protein ABSH25_12020 [Syntrophorhabdales bacterium]|jgi:hypothetical protein
MGTEIELELEKLRRMTVSSANQSTLLTELKGSSLPSFVQDDLKKQVENVFGSRLASTEEIRNLVRREEVFVATVSGSVARSSVVTEEVERVQAALDKLFGVEVDDKFSQVKPFAGLRAAYTRFTGDEDLTGRCDPHYQKFNEAFAQYMNLAAAFSTSSFAYALGNTMYRRLVQEYKAVDYGEQYLISEERNAKDFKTMESIRIGYFSDLPDVNPELLDYNEVQMVDDEEVAYHINQKGLILTITRKAMINDDLRTTLAMVKRLGRAAKRTLARRAWNVLINNATYQPDGLALFCLQHNNLGSISLTNDATGIGSLTAAMAAMYGQTEKDSGEVIALDTLHEFVPRALQETARALNMPWPMGGIFNPHAGAFGMQNENIHTVALLTDPYDWYLTADKADCELLEVAYLRGQKEPEMFLASNPLEGQMFIADKLQYKIRHEYEVVPVDYRGFYKSMPGGL